MNPRTLIGFLLALLIGIVCRLLDVPLPAPEALIGSLIVLSITLGYLLTDSWLQRRARTTGPR